MQRSIQLRGAAIPFYKAFNPEPKLQGKTPKVAARDKKIVSIPSVIKAGRWMFAQVICEKQLEVKLTPTATRNAIAIKGVNGSLDHHHHKSDIAKSNLAEYERSTAHAISRDFFAKKAPLPDHPLHPKTADPLDTVAFHERWTLDHRARTVNDMRLGPDKIQNYVLAKKVVTSPESKKQ